MNGVPFPNAWQQNLANRPIVKGDLIEVVCQGHLIRGIVDTAENNPDGYYIQFKHWHTGLPHYWKQPYDGGRVTLMDKETT